VELSSSAKPLAEQLQLNYGCGFEIHAWSYLPHGSGMGTSSILAGAVCAAIWKITSRNYDNQELLHLVVELEQMLTTGGGWQDQVGGLIPGVKITTSPPGTAIKVFPKVLDVSDETLQKVTTNMALIYTGKTRLAKDLLQVLLRVIDKQAGIRVRLCYSHAIKFIHLLSSLLALHFHLHGDVFVF
jgi:fucokinase